jgi:hypothetical protein
VSVFASACGPVNPPPPGYVEACYGGDFRENLEGSLPKRLIIVRAAEGDWPRLASDLTAAGKDMGLEVFDTSTSLDHVRTIEIHLCSAQGIWIRADQRKWLGEHAESANQHRNFNEVPIDVRAYRNDFDWKSVSDELVRMLGKSWQLTEHGELQP